MDFLKSSINLPALSTGTSLMKMSGGLGNGATQMSSMESMKEVFLEIRDNTKETVELLKTMVLGDATQDKKDAIAAGDTDTDKKPKEKGPGILSRVMGGLKGAFSSLMPEKGGFMDTLLRLGLAVGGIALLKYFGDDMVPVLADLLKAIKEGKIGDKIKEAYEYIKGIGVDAFEKLRDRIVLLIETVVMIKNKILEYVDKIKAMFKPLLDYIDGFDIDKDGKFDPMERRALKEDIEQRIKTFIYNMIGETLLAVGAVFGLVTVANIMTKINKIPGKGAGIGLMGTAALVALAAAGIYKLYNAVNFALDEALDKETGEIETTQFIASLMAGRNPEGGLPNAAINTFDKGLIGLSVGAIIGFLIGGPGGAIMGARIGAMAGSVIGAITGYAGSDEMKDTMDNMKSTIADSIDAITSTILGVPSKYDMDIPRLTEEKKAVDEALNVAQSAKYKDTKLIDDLTAQSEDLQGRIDRAPDLIQQMRGVNVDQMTDDIASNESAIANAKKQLSKDNLFPGSDRGYFNQVKNGQFPKGDLGSESFKAQFGHGLKNAFQLPYDEQIIYYTNMNKLIKENRAKVISEKNANEVPGNLTMGNLDQYQAVKKFNPGKSINQELVDQRLPTGGYAEKMRSMVVNSGNDSSVKVANENNILGNLSQDNRHFTALALGYKQMKMQTR